MEAVRVVNAVGTSTPCQVCGEPITMLVLDTQTRSGKGSLRMARGVRTLCGCRYVLREALTLHTFVVTRDGKSSPPYPDPPRDTGGAAV